MTKPLKVIDLFCGIGGMSHGFYQEGFEIVAGVDVDSSCEYSFEKNNASKFICKDISKLTKDELVSLYGDDEHIKVMIGCAPCQPFSSYNNIKIEDRKKWDLLLVFAEKIKMIRPEIVAMENVPSIKNFKRYPVYQEFLTILKNLGYSIDDHVVYCPDYGIPQTRKRLTLVASRIGDIKLIDKTHTPDNYVAVKDVISHLPKIEDGEACEHDPLHKARKLSPINKRRIQATKHDGGGWENWSEELKPDCYKRESGKSFHNVYGRMKWSKPAPTMTTQCVGLGNGRFGHPEQDRAISLREAAIFQTFPDHYEFVDPKLQTYTFQTLARQIGNAVPPKLGRIVAQSVKEHLKLHGYL